MTRSSRKKARIRICAIFLKLSSISSTRDISRLKTNWMRWRRLFEASLIGILRGETLLASCDCRNGCGKPHPLAAIDLRWSFIVYKPATPAPETVGDWFP